MQFSSPRGGAGAEDLVFSIVFAAGKDNQVPSLYSLVATCIDLLQLVAFALPSALAWRSGVSADTVGFLATFQAEGSYAFSLFEALFWMAVVLVWSTFALAILVGTNFQRNRFAYVLPVRVFRALSLLGTLLYIPTARILLRIIPCRGGSTFFYPTRECFGAYELVMAVVGSATALVLVTFAGTMALLFFEYHPRSRHVLARPHSRADFVIFVLKSVLVGLDVFFHKELVVRTLANVVAAAAMLAVMLAMMPHYREWTNRLRAGFFSIFFFAAVIGFAVAVHGSDPGWPILVFLGGALPAYYLGSALARARVRRLTDIHSALLTGAGSADADGRITLAHVSLPRLRRDLDIVPATAFLEHHRSSQAFQVAECLYRHAMELFPDSQFLRTMEMLFESFQSETSGLVRQRILQLKASDEDMDFDLRFIIHRREREILLSNALRGGKGNLLNFVELQAMTSRAQRNHLGALQALADYWSAASHTDPAAIKGEDIARLASKLAYHESQALRLYAAVLTTDHDNPQLLRRIGCFVEDVVGNSAAARRFYRLADHVEDEGGRLDQAPPQTTRPDPFTAITEQSEPKSLALEVDRSGAVISAGPAFADVFGTDIPPLGRTIEELIDCRALHAAFAGAVSMAGGGDTDAGAASMLGHEDTGAGALVPGVGVNSTVSTSDLITLAEKTLTEPTSGGAYDGPGAADPVHESDRSIASGGSVPSTAAVPAPVSITYDTLETMPDLRQEHMFGPAPAVALATSNVIEVELTSVIAVSDRWRVVVTMAPPVPPLPVTGRSKPPRAASNTKGGESSHRLTGRMSNASRLRAAASTLGSSKATSSAEGLSVLSSISGEVSLQTHMAKTENRRILMLGTGFIVTLITLFVATFFLVQSFSGVVIRQIDNVQGAEMIALFAQNVGIATRSQELSLFGFSSEDPLLVEHETELFLNRYSALHLALYFGLRDTAAFDDLAVNSGVVHVSPGVNDGHWAFFRPNGTVGTVDSRPTGTLVPPSTKGSLTADVIRAESSLTNGTDPRLALDGDESTAWWVPSHSADLSLGFGARVTIQSVAVSTRNAVAMHVGPEIVLDLTPFEEDVLVQFVLPAPLVGQTVDVVLVGGPFVDPVELSSLELFGRTTEIEEPTHEFDLIPLEEWVKKLRHKRRGGAIGRFYDEPSISVEELTAAGPITHEYGLFELSERLALEADKILAGLDDGDHSALLTLHDPSFFFVMRNVHTTIADAFSTLIDLFVRSVDRWRDSATVLLATLFSLSLLLTFALVAYVSIRVVGRERRDRDEALRCVTDLPLAERQQARRQFSARLQSFQEMVGSNGLDSDVGDLGAFDTDRERTDSDAGAAAEAPVAKAKEKKKSVGGRVESDHGGAGQRHSLRGALLRTFLCAALAAAIFTTSFIVSAAELEAASTEVHVTQLVTERNQAAVALRVLSREIVTGRGAIPDDVLWQRYQQARADLEDRHRVLVEGSSSLPSSAGIREQAEILYTPLGCAAIEGCENDVVAEAGLNALVQESLRAARDFEMLWRSGGAWQEPYRFFWVGNGVDYIDAMSELSRARFEKDTKRSVEDAKIISDVMLALSFLAIALVVPVYVTIKQERMCTHRITRTLPARVNAPGARGGRAAIYAV